MKQVAFLIGVSFFFKSLDICNIYIFFPDVDVRGSMQLFCVCYEYECNNFLKARLKKQDVPWPAWSIGDIPTWREMVCGC